MPETGRAGLSRRVEQLVEAVVSGTVAAGPDAALIARLTEEARCFDCSSTRVVAFGGGTGLSTVMGGNSQFQDWPENPFVGLKQRFSSVDVVVCTTDDGGSTGLLLQQLPIIAIGDLRKLLLSLILRENLEKAYGLDEDGVMRLVLLAHRIFNHRFPAGSSDFEYLLNPLLAAPKKLREFCPESLAATLCGLGRYVSSGGEGPTIKPGGHSLGNLLLTAAILRESPDAGRTYPRLDAICRGLDFIACAIGATPGRLHPATPTPGQLVVRYSNGVAVRGQHKSALTRRDFPIDGISVEFCEDPVISQDLCEAIRKADLILFAPGSVYTSVMPILLLPPLVRAIKENRKALKILGANFLIQEGETDVSRRGRNRGFHASELVEAYERNVPGGVAGLFDVVISANLEHMPGSVLSNYALEGKSPIFFDRNQVEALGVLPIEATIYSRQRLATAQLIRHDPESFASAIRTLLFAHQRFNLKGAAAASPVPVPSPVQVAFAHTSPLCGYQKAAAEMLAGKRFSPRKLRQTLLEIVWENRDIRIEHLSFLRGARLIATEKWSRSKEWDNVLGYYDPADGMVKIHEGLQADQERMKDNLLIALGESLLGRYVESRQWIGREDGDQCGARCFEIRLRPAGQRGCFLDDGQLHAYLALSRMVQCPGDPLTYRITLNGDEGFIPPGLLFGLLYAWYLNNAYGGLMEYEMSLLRWPPNKLIPCQLEERKRKQALIAFFRKVVFGHTD